MRALSLLVRDEPGVLQRVLGLFTRKRVNVETLLAGPCERPAMARIVLTVAPEGAAQVLLEHLRRLEVVAEAEILEPPRTEAQLAVLEGAAPALHRGTPEALRARAATLPPGARYILTVHAL